MLSGWRLLERAPALLVLVSFCAVAGQTLEVSVAEYRFQPPILTIKVGDTVRWINREKRTSHSLVFPEEGGRESERIFPDESWSRIFEQSGRYPYTCGPHPEMKGVIVVE